MREVAGGSSGHREAERQATEPPLVASESESGTQAVGPNGSPGIEVPSKAWQALAVGAAGMVLFGFNATATNLAFGAIADTFPGVSERVVAWVASGYFIASAAFLPLGGRLADRLGRRRIFNLGLIGFAAFALVSAVAPSIWVLIAGRIGQAVADRARAFDMEILAYDPFLDPAMAKRIGVELLELDELLPRADFITLHTPLTEQTRNLIDAARIAQMKPGSRLINCGRGGVIDEQALLVALDEGHLAGAALDVFAQEPPTDWRLIQHDKVVATPHIGAQTQEAQARVATDTVRMVLGALGGSLSVTAVNLPFGAPGQKGAPYLGLAQQLGRLASSLLPGGLAELRVDSWGIDEPLQNPITVAAVKGALTPALGDVVNYVNAARLAESRGIKVVHSAHQGPTVYAHLIGVTVSNGQQSVRLEGTLFSDEDPRVVGFGEYRLEFSPSGTLLVMQNRDVPGVVGRLGMTLGEGGVNIAEIHLARQSGGEAAVAVVRLDSAPAAEVLVSIRAFDEVEDVQLVDLGEG